MVFSSMTFLCCALPLALAVYYLLPRGLRNPWLLLFSLGFYAWGEPVYLALMLASVSFNWLCGMALGRARPAARKALLILAVAVNLGLLIGFKYLGFFARALNGIPGMALPVPDIALPIGISFYTFQALSYVIDVYRGEVAPQKRWGKLALYISFFPQLIAGPILRYGAVQGQIDSRRETLDGFTRGLRRFALGLGKKVLIANAVARIADEAFAHPGLTLPAAWLGAVAYALQIYFDFSGYSDMAIGLGGMFGFSYPENFDAPYTAVTARDFWRRWHMTLSGWFRDYVYIPLGGSRVSRGRHLFNLMAVFLLTGLWHGAGASFLVWGLYWGLLCCAEAALELRPSGHPPVRVMQRVCTLLLILLGWVLFRADTPPEALRYLRGMLVPGARSLQSLTPRAALMLGLGALGATGLRRRWLDGIPPRTRDALGLAAAPALILLCLIALASDSYNPFIYFRF